MASVEPAQLSVVIPTYNRCDMLRRTLESLVSQQCPPGRFEVIVADDGSADESLAVTRSFRDRLRINYCYQEDRGFRAAAARNAGARLATAPLLAFLDTGTLAGPDFVQSHIDCHQSPGTRAVIGYCYGYRVAGDPAWLDDAVGELGLPGTVARYGGQPDFKDVRHEGYEKVRYEIEQLMAPWVFFWSMNISLPAAGFWEAGGFDETYTSWGGEDTELGYRLHRHGMQFHVCRGAWTIELPHGRRQRGNRQSLKRNLLRFLAKHCDPLVEVYCESILRERVDNVVQEINPVEEAGGQLAAWAPTAAGLDVLGEIEKALQGIPQGRSIAVFGCGDTLPRSLPPAVVADFDDGMLARATAAGAHTGYHAMGVRLPLRLGSVDTVIITSRLGGLWDQWGDQILAEAGRIGRSVRAPFLDSAL